MDDEWKKWNEKLKSFSVLFTGNLKSAAKWMFWHADELFGATRVSHRRNSCATSRGLPIRSSYSEKYESVAQKAAEIRKKWIRVEYFSRKKKIRVAIALRPVAVNILRDSTRRAHWNFKDQASLKIALNYSAPDIWTRRHRRHFMRNFRARSELKQNFSFKNRNSVSCSLTQRCFEMKSSSLSRFGFL